MSSPEPSSPGVSQRMAAQASTGTSPEMALRRELHRRGLRYRVNYRPEPSIRRTPDVTFTRARVVVFVDGCFWHACPEHGTQPKANAEWWSTKLARNVERDRETDAAFREHGWKVLRVWEHECLAEAANRVAELVRRG